MTDETQDPQEFEGGEVEAVEAPAPEAEAPAQPEHAPDDVEEARLFGWKSPDEWVGDKPAGYIEDPKRFLDRIKESRIFKTLDAQREAERKRMEDHLRRLDHVAQQTIKAQKEDYERRIADIETRQRRAVETADVAAFDALEKQKRTMQAPQFEPGPEQPQGPSPVVAEYAEKNDWVKDPALRMEGAQAIDIAMKSGMQFRDDAEQLAYAESVMKRKYPHMFQAPAPAPVAPSGPAKVDGGGLAGGSPLRSGAFTKLPPEAHAAFKKDVERGLFTNDEKGRNEYARLYNEG
jgi:hypothetical protein